MALVKSSWSAMAFREAGVWEETTCCSIKGPITMGQATQPSLLQKAWSSALLWPNTELQ